MSKQPLPRLVLPAVALVQTLLTSSPLSAQIDGSWKDDASGNWSSASAWVSGTVPGGAGSIVNLTNNITASRTITINTTSRTVGILNIGDQEGNDPFTVAASGGASLIFDNGGSASQLNFSTSGGFNVISAPISLLSSLTIASASSGLQTLSGNISAGSAGTKTITNAGAGSGGVTISGTISSGSGTVAVTQNSASSTLTLSATNTYTGNTTLSQGRLQVGSNSALGSGTLIINGGALSSNSINTRAISNAVVLGANVTLGDATNTGQLTMGGATALTGNRTLTVAAGSHAFWSGLITETGGTFGLTKEGDGILTLSAQDNAFAGGLTLNAGTIRMGGNRTLGTGALTLNGGTLSASSATARAISNAVTVGGNMIFGDATLTGLLTFSGTTTLTGNRTFTVNSAVTVSGTLRETGGSHSLTKNGSAALTISGTSSYTGGTIISSGTLLLGKAEVLANSGAVTVEGGVFDLGTWSETVGAVSITGGTIANGTLTGASYTATGGSINAVLAGGGAFTKNGEGTVILAGANTYSGGTTITEGVLQLGASDRLADSGAVTVTGGKFDLGGFTETVGAVSITGGSIDNGVLTASSYAVTGGTIGARLAGSGGFTKNGGGTTTLSGSSSYTGATAVNAGTLEVASGGNVNSSSGISVQTGGRLVYNSASSLTSTLSLNGSGISNRAILSGSGTIHSAITLNDVGDTLAPGNSPGTLNFTVSQSWDAFSYDWEVNNFLGTVAGADFDQISILGSLDLNASGSYILNILSLTSANESGWVGGFENTQHSWTILTTTEGILDFDASKWSFNLTGFSANPDYAGAFSITRSLDGRDLVLVYDAVPEPSTVLLLGAALGLGAILRRRNRR